MANMLGYRKTARSLSLNPACPKEQQPARVKRMASTRLFGKSSDQQNAAGNSDSSARAEHAVPSTSQ